MADGTLVVTMSNPFGDRCQDNKVVLTWMSETTGALSKAVCSTFSTAQAAISPSYPQPSRLRGFIRKIETNPAGTGGTIPTDNYDITLLDADGVDVAAGSLADRDSTTSEVVIPAAPIYIDTELTFTLASAGSNTLGACTLYLANE
jgi:hypothetical protein